MKRKGQVTIYLLWMAAAIVIVIIAGIFAPMGVLFNTKLYAAGDDILARTQDDINDIQNTTVRNAVNTQITEARAGGLFAIEVNNDLFQYSWIFVLIMSALIAFLYTRRLVEVGGFT